MKIDIFDTTLRDGFQQEGISPSVKDKLAIAELLDELVVDFIEGGWPGASPKEEEFFDRAKTELKLKNAKLVNEGQVYQMAMPHAANDDARQSGPGDLWRFGSGRRVGDDPRPVPPLCRRKGHPVCPCMASER